MAENNRKSEQIPDARILASLDSRLRQTHEPYARKNPNRATMSKTNDNDRFPMFKNSNEPWRDEERIEWMQKKIGVGKEKATQIIGSINAFSEDNDSVRRFQSTGEDRFRQNITAENLELYISKAPKFKEDTYRGVSLSKKDIQQLDGYLQRNIPINMGRFSFRDNEEEGTFSALSSWTTDKDVANHFAGDNKSKFNPQKVIFVCKGGQTKGASISPFAGKYEGQQEIVCSKNAQWTIKGKEYKDGILYYTLTAK